MTHDTAFPSVEQMEAMADNLFREPCGHRFNSEAGFMLRAIAAHLRKSEPVACLTVCTSRNELILNLEDLKDSILEDDPSVGIFRDESQAEMISALIDLLNNTNGHVKLYTNPPSATEVVITRNESGQIVAVTRQDSEGRVLEVLAESTPSTADAEDARRYRKLRALAKSSSAYDRWKGDMWSIDGLHDPACKGFDATVDAMPGEKSS